MSATWRSTGRPASTGWDYCGSILVNSYPTYFEKLPPLIAKINRERRNSKNYVLFLGETGAESNQAPCLSLVQFQLDGGELVLSAYQRSSDANLGLPSDIYHLYLMARQIELPLKSITLYLGNVHIYENNIQGTRALLAGDEAVRFGAERVVCCICLAAGTVHVSRCFRLFWGPLRPF